MKIAAELPKVNYHSHTVRCQHASGTEEEYVLQAIDLGLETLGFSDHTPWPYTNGYVSDMRMPISMLESYLETVKALKEKYAGQIRVLLGLECESFPAYMGWLSDLKAEHLDYVIMGNHFDTDDSLGVKYFGSSRTPQQMGRYADSVIAGMETGLYNYVAHPDLFGRLYSAVDADYIAVSRDICAAAKQLNIPLEYNLLGLADNRIYPSRRFFRLAADMGVSVIIGSDAHSPDRVAQPFELLKAYHFLNELAVKPIDELHFRRIPKSI